MARGGGGSELWDVVGLAVVGIVAYFALSSGALDGILKSLTEGLKGLSIPSIPMPGGGAGGGPAAAPGGSTGSCSGGPYKGTGKVVNTTKKGPLERHYASGKADTTTIEQNAHDIAFKNYQFVSYVTLQEVGSDDNISVKLAGTHDGGWLDHGISFSGKKVCLGVEKNHPHTDACEVEGPGNIGDLKGKKIGIAGVWFASGNTEIWYDIGGGWKKGASGSKIGGFTPSSGNHETQLRIDDAPKLTIHCSNVQEIGPGGGGAPVAARARAYSTRFDTIDVKKHTDCGSLNYYYY